MTKRVTIKDVAAAAEVSFQVVSDVLNNKKSRSVSPATRERIIACAKTLGYRPNKSARSLVSGKYNTIGVLLNSPTDTFYANLSAHIQAQLAAKGYGCLFSFWVQGREGLKEAYRGLIEQGVDGLIACDWIDGGCPANIPLVTLTNKAPGCDLVMNEYREGFDNAASCLTKLNRKKIGYLGVTKDARFLSQLNDALKKAELALSPEWILDMPGTLEQGKAGAEWFLNLSKRPEAVFVHNIEFAIAFTGALVEHGINIPKELSVISCNNTAIANYIYPKICGLKVDTELIARALTDKLFAKIANPDKTPEEIGIKAEFVWNKSIG